MLFSCMGSYFLTRNAVPATVLLDLCHICHFPYATGTAATCSSYALCLSLIWPRVFVSTVNMSLSKTYTWKTHPHFAPKDFVAIQLMTLLNSRLSYINFNNHCLLTYLLTYYLLTYYLLTYLITYLLTYLLTHSLTHFIQQRNS
jgi:hypothetical protein